METILIRKARKADLSKIALLIVSYSRQGKLLPRRKKDLAKQLKNFFVAEISDEVVGCACLEIYGKKMAEIRSLAVDSKHFGKGIGTALVASCIAKAKKKKILEVMAITSQEKFFQNLGFNYTLPGERKALFVNP